MKIRNGFSTVGGGCSFMTKDLPDISELIKYVNKTGWHRKEHPNPNIMLYSGYEDDNGQPINMVLPKNYEYEGARRQVHSSIGLIAALQKKQDKEMREELYFLGKDILKLIIRNKGSVILPLEAISKITSSLRDLIYFAACAEKTQRPFFYRGFGVCKQYTKSCKFDYTIEDDYDFYVEMPATFKDQDENDVIYGNRILERILNGLQDLQNCIIQKTSSYLIDNYMQGFNANLCEVFSEFLDCMADFNFEYSLNFFTSVTTIQDDSLIFQPDEAHKYLISAAKSLRNIKEQGRVSFIGHIIQLRTGFGKGAKDKRTVIAHGNTEINKDITVKIELSLEEYRIACDAHKENIPISIKGFLKRSGRYWILDSPKDFTSL